jgi:hypothetical protein
VTSSKNFTAAQKKAVAAFNKAYTKTVNTLLKNSKTNALVKGPDGKTTPVNAGKLAQALERQTFDVDGSGQGHPGAPISSLPGESFISPSTGLKAPAAGSLYGITGKTTASERWMIVITHEAIHAGAPWADNMWAGRSDFYIGHQTPYAQAAAELLQ